MCNILLVEDDILWATIIKHDLKKYGNVMHVTNSNSAKQVLAKDKIDLVFADLELKDGTKLGGANVVSMAKKLNIYTIVLSSRDDDETINLLLDECKADNYFIKPSSKNDLSEQLENMFKEYEKTSRGSSIEVLLDSNIFTTSMTYRKSLLESLKVIDDTTENALVVGETGTGKTRLVNKVISKLIDPSKEVIRVDCGSFSKELVDGALFGHEKGAFTGADNQKIGFIEKAKGKILFLDDVQNLSIKGQQNLRTIIDEGFFYRVGGNTKIYTSVNIIFGATDEIDTFVKEGDFRLDVYQRISRNRINTLPLRFRKSDILPFIKLFAKEHYPKGKVFRISDDAKVALKQMDWEGNTRQIENSVINWSKRGIQKLNADHLDIDGLNPRSHSDIEEGFSDDQKEYLKTFGYKAFVEKIREDAMKYIIETSKTDLEAAKKYNVNRSIVYKYRKKILEEQRCH
ncbi:MAG: sigma 54-interacting transcriptional regulator [Bacteriovoracaceae bacterium]|jgi:two-component system response regulator HydG|nr:sigma 54-interacting transcriptional regulator [Bacteriovoracaceae bacterium]